MSVTDESPAELPVIDSTVVAGLPETSMLSSFRVRYGSFTVFVTNTDPYGSLAAYELRLKADMSFPPYVVPAATAYRVHLLLAHQSWLIVVLSRVAEFE